MIEERPFQYVPAGITTNPCSFVAVKYQDNTKHPGLWKRVKFAGLVTSWYPDRTLYEGANTNRVSGVGDVDYDEILLTGPSSHPEILEAAGFRYGMASPVHTSKEAETRRNKSAKIFSDSGGFQLLTGAKDFIDPLELAEYYNRAVDLGIGLDIPVFGNNDLLQRMCKIMLKNNKILRRELKPEVTVYEVSHGSTLKTRKEFLDTLLKEKELSNALAVGGIAQNYKDGGFSTTLVSGAINLMYVLHRTRKIFRQYHILGTTSGFFQAVYWLVQRHGLVTHITADSTTWVRQSINNLIILDRLEKPARVETAVIPKTERTHLLPCSCPACYITKYALAYNRNSRINQIHSLYALAAHGARIEQMVDEYYAGKLTLTELASLVSNRQHAPIVTAIFKFCIDVATTSFKAAYEKHYATLSHLTRGNKVSLFGGDLEKGKDPVVRKRLLDVLERYEKYHK